VTSRLLEVTGLTAGYGDIVALRDVSLHVEAGEVVAVLGPNGAGKTTLLSAISGLRPLMQGDVAVDGVSVAKVAAYKRVAAGVALVQENKRVFKKMTVRDNLVVAAPRMSKADFEQRTEEATEYFPAIRRFMERPAGELSGGQQQMLAISQALMVKPRVLLLDEPSAGLAPKLTTEVMDQVAQIADQGIGVLLVEQAVHEAIRIATRVYTLRLGRCREESDFKTADKLALIEGLYLSDAGVGKE
jgi:branched-chain amino acid transport system ATP-binding protein